MAKFSLSSNPENRRRRKHSGLGTRFRFQTYFSRAAFNSDQKVRFSREEGMFKDSPRCEGQTWHSSYWRNLCISRVCEFWKWIDCGCFFSFSWLHCCLSTPFFMLYEWTLYFSLSVPTLLPYRTHSATTMRSKLMALLLESHCLHLNILLSVLLSHNPINQTHCYPWVGTASYLDAAISSVQVQSVVYSNKTGVLQTFSSIKTKTVLNSICRG